MSVEYYLACDKHKEFVWVCSDGFSGPLLQAGRPLAAFTITHRKCELRVVEEQAEPEDYAEWNNENWKDLLRYDAADD